MSSNESGSDDRSGADCVGLKLVTIPPSGRNPPPLCTEILEMIIDCVWEELDELDFYSNCGEEYRTLCAFALTCGELLIRSRYNLLRRVSLLTGAHLDSFKDMLDSHPGNRPLVQELTVLSTTDAHSPAENICRTLAERLPNLRVLRIRTEIKQVDYLEDRPTIFLDPSAFGGFSSVCRLELNALYFKKFEHFLLLQHALRGLRTVQCYQLWFDDECRLPQGWELSEGMQLEHLDLAFFEPSGMKCLLEAVKSEHVKELIIAPDRAYLAGEVQGERSISIHEYTQPPHKSCRLNLIAPLGRRHRPDTFATIRSFKNLESFTINVGVTSAGAAYADVIDLLNLLPTNKVRTIRLEHYVEQHDFSVPKQAALDALQRHAPALERALDPARFPHAEAVVFQFQGFHGSEPWWLERLEPILPKRAKASPHEWNVAC